MPTVLRVGPYRFFFYSSDGREPPHIHVEVGDNVAKFWLDPLKLARSGGFSDQEVRKMERIIGKHLDDLLEAWHAYFGTP